MGSKGSKPRKANHSQHLPKVGTRTENERLLHEERHAVAEVMGVGDSTWPKYLVIGIGVFLLVAAVVSLMFVLIFV